MNKKHKITMKWINPREAFSKKKSFHGGMLRLVLIAGLLAAFLITRQGILDPRPQLRKPLPDNELRQVITAMTIPAVPAPDAREHRLAAFGRKLFFDSRLSSNGQVSCATCHQPDKSFTDGLPVAKGTGTTARNAPTILNSRFAHWFFWDGRADSLAAQAVGPLENPDEHGLDRSSLAAAILAHHGPEYRALFNAPPPASPGAAPNSAPGDSKRLAAYTLASIGPYGRMTEILKLASNRSTQPATLVAGALVPTGPVAAEKDRNHGAATRVVANAASAIEAWERLQIADQSPFDGFIRAATENPDAPLATLATSNPAGFSSDALAGLRIFTGKGNCVLCHRGPLLSDQQFHNIGLGDTPRLDELPVEKWLTDVSGRARGQFEARDPEFNCLAPVWNQERGATESARRDSESCREQRFMDPDNYEAVGAFKTPTLRNVALTAPYFHDGRAASLDDVIHHYDKLTGDPVIGHREESLRPLDLTPVERKQLRTFLESLTSPTRDLSIAR